MTIYRNLLIVVFLGFCLMANGQQSVSQQTEEILLYPKVEEIIEEEHIHDPAGNLIVAKVTNPSLTVFIPTDGNKSKAAVIICPGGGYSNLHIQREGFRVAEAFNRQGIAAFVLKYRLPDTEIIVKDISFVPLKDAQRAIQLTRENAEQWGIDPHKIGIMGFSAGGHLASTAGVHYDSVFIENSRGTSLRPDFMILVYPVISFDDQVGHIGSKKRLLGDHPDEDLVKFFSNELQVNNNTPKSILLHADDDTLVPVENSSLFYSKLHDHGVPAELHIYSKGNHGFGSTPSFEEWFNQCIYWMKAEQLHPLNK
ncbi:alpha/beta hydrolase [uncultured Proteiniphilum sp.]|uniref:alpha/beta hydrolase n=1 Tax=uncultured Proteiniphilum sp. TaxID=497637 RepID=UPI0026370AA6|nr:alpha/beta hydrolase [uncultured Proteiniphilum sp.]